MNILNRQSIRLPDCVYSGAGVYFITKCIQNRKCLPGKVENDLMVLNEYGLLTDAIRTDLPNSLPWFVNRCLDGDAKPRASRFDFRCRGDS